MHVALLRVACGETLAVRRGLISSFLLFAQLGAIGEADPQGGIGSSVARRAAYVTETEFPGYVGIANGDSLRHRATYTLA
jgi:hypothetical protein